MQGISHMQADIARGHVRRAGHDRVCTMCGGEPQGDFQLTYRPEAYQLRLCPHCLGICRDAYGEDKVQGATTA